MNEITFEEAPPARTSHTISEAVLVLWRNPYQFVRYWNYKGAILSGVLRAPIFFITYLIGKEGLKLAIGAALVQFTFRFFFAGIGGALIQSFRRVEPPWKAFVAILLLVPLVSHVLEFGFQAGFAYLTGTQDHTGDAILRSIAVSIISAFFTLFAMRRGIMIVGESESKSLMNDISQLPVVIFHFIAFIPNEISSMLRRGAYLGAMLSVAAFGVFSQIIVWAVTNKPLWTYNNGKTVGLLKYWGVDGMVLMVIAIAISTAVFSYQRAKAHSHK
ncbi:MAG: hypothetical protein QUS14_06135 [Pyrinomonadaceae bacterium]|nr:hypothetical protein [Pyrinomonadaceae bacterium]